MNIENVGIFHGNTIKILEMVLENDNNQLELSWKIYIENKVFFITFYNVSRFRIGELSIPLEIHGFEIINHSQNAWEKDSAYEIRDFEDDCVHFFCEYFKINENATDSTYISGGY